MPISPEKLKEIKIFFPFLCYNHQANTEWMDSILQMFLVLQQAGIKFDRWWMTSDSLIPRARNSALVKFLQSDCTHLMFIDSDIQFHITGILKLIEADLPIVAGGYPKKQINYERIKEGIPIEAQCDFPICGKMNGDNKLMYCEHLPTGFMLIRRDCVEKLIVDNPHLEYVNDVPGYPTGKYYNLFGLFIHEEYHNLLSEDFAFSELCKKSGFQCAVVPDITLVHWGWAPFVGNFASHVYHVISKSENCVKFEGNNQQSTEGTIS